MGKTLTADEILNLLRQQKEFLHQKFHVTKIGLFGSFASNEATDNSDIDFLVEFDAPLPVYIANRYALYDYLRDMFGRDIDLANPKSLKPFYKDAILSQAVYA